MSVEQRRVFVAPANPTTSDDVQRGYRNGDLWVALDYDAETVSLRTLVDSSVGTWIAVSGGGGGGGLSDGDYGDVTVSGGGTAMAVDAVGGASAASVASAVSTLSSHTASTTAHGISAFGATLVDDANASAARTTLGIVIDSDIPSLYAMRQLWALGGLR